MRNLPPTRPPAKCAANHRFSPSDSLPWLRKRSVASPTHANSLPDWRSRGVVKGLRVLLTWAHRGALTCPLRRSSAYCPRRLRCQLRKRDPEHTSGRGSGSSGTGARQIRSRGRAGDRSERLLCANSPRPLPRIAVARGSADARDARRTAPMHGGCCVKVGARRLRGNLLRSTSERSRARNGPSGRCERCGVPPERSRKDRI